MKKFIAVIGFVAAMSGCVKAPEAAAYAVRAHPECTGHTVVAHSYGGEGQSMTEVQMTCGGNTRSITIKCKYGFGLISDTVCHENN